MNEKNLVSNFMKGVNAPIAIIGEAIVTVKRFDGSVEVYRKENQVSYNGLNALASRAVSDTTSPFGWIAVGTLTAAASIDSEITSFGEVDRKPMIGGGQNSNDIFYGVASWGGNADGVTSLSLASAAIVNHVNSGLGIPMNIVNDLGPVVLADSDFMQLEMRIRVGSHNV